MAKILLTEYNENWECIFQIEKEALMNINGIKRIDHFGSTAIKGILSKPIVDILMQICDDCSLDELIDNLKTMGYINDIYSCCLEYPTPPMIFLKGYSRESSVEYKIHLHIRFNDEANDLLLCNYLKQHPKSAKEYERLKLQLAQEYFNNPPEYASGKLEFVNNIKYVAKNQFRGISEEQYLFYPNNKYLSRAIKWFETFIQQVGRERKMNG